MSSPSMDGDGFQEMVDRLVALLGDIDASQLHPGSVMAEAEARLMEDRDRAPVFSTSGGVRLLRYDLDTQGLRWWFRGTPEAAALSRVSDDDLVRLVQTASGVHAAALEGLDDYADWLGKAATRGNRPSAHED